jgi:hypothetical protein
VLVKSVVFIEQEAISKFFGYRIGGREAPLPVGSDTRTEQLSVAVGQYSAGGVCEKLTRQTNYPPNQSSKGSAGQYRKPYFPVSAHPVCCGR